MARHLQLDSLVAIKFLAPEYALAPEAHARFEREAKASARLRSPHVVQVHDYGITDGVPHLVMELLDGEDLQTRLAREERLSPLAALQIVVPVCKALRQAHEAGLVHRDLKPGNIFFARQGDEEVVKILDFGIAKITGPERPSPATKTGTLLGSPYYMSPEQVRGRKDVDFRSDLWSVGVIVYRCLTGRLPFPCEELGELLVSICTDDPPLASEVAPDLGPFFDTFLARALARDPAARFQSAAELGEAYAAATSPTNLAAGGTFSSTESPLAQMAGRSRRAWIPPLALLCLALILGFGGAMYRLTPPAAPIAGATAASVVASDEAPKVLRAPEPAPVLPSASPPSAPPSASVSVRAIPAFPAKNAPAPPSTKTRNSLPERNDDPLKHMR